jgi:CheY-like chemotaxis protein
MPEDALGSKGGETILYVEDDADVRETVELLLGGLGYDLVVAATALEAHELLLGRPDVDLLFSDIVMPGGMDGVELTLKARALRPDLKVVLTSGYSESVLKTMPSALPNVHWLAKPFQFDELAETIRDALDGRPPTPFIE